ncbi:MAG: twin-arginine translocase subunit TatC [Rickettsiales bacterium]|nr:twin-arginine translocase subunit TatC [Rickettsiales bacterium]
MKQKETLAQLPLFDHFSELRSRVIGCAVFFAIAFVLFYTMRADIYDFMTAPLAKALKDNGLPPALIYTRLTEAFTSSLSLVLKTALLASMPYFAAQAWLYVAPGLYRDERRAAAPYVIAAPILFTLGMAFAYTLVLPMAFKFLTSFIDNSAVETPLVLQAKIGEYVALASSMLFAFGVCFLTPLILVFTVRAGVVSCETLRRGRKYWIVAAFVIAAVLTPPDVASQVLLAIPLILMYEVAILLTRRPK